MTDLAFRVDDHTDPAGIATRSRSLGRAIGQPHGPIPIAQQGVGERELRMEGRVVLGRVEAHTQNRGVLGRIFTLEVAEPATLDRSTGCVGLGVEPQNEMTSAVVRERVRRTGMVAHGKIRSLGTDF